MEHRETYSQLLSPVFRAALIRAVHDQGYFTDLKASKVEVVEAEPLPYLRFELESDGRFTAVCGGLFLDLEGVVPEPPPGRYYFPYVGLTPLAEPGDLEHELAHLEDLLELLRVEPAYARDAERLGITQVEPALLAQSVAFEVRKIFMLEAPAFGREYDEGNQAVDVPVLPGLKLKYRCASREEYVALWMATYLTGLKQRYLERFPKRGPDIQRCLEKATDMHAEHLVGPGAWRSLMATWNGMPERLVAQVTARLQREESRERRRRRGPHCERTT